MRPFLLTFPNREVERQYRQSQTRGVWLDRDRAWLIFSLPFRLLVWGLTPSEPGLSWLKGLCLLYLLSWAAELVVVYVMMGSEQLSTRRVSLVRVARLVHVTCLGIVIPRLSTLLLDTLPPLQFPVLPDVLEYLVSSGVAAQMILSAFLPLPFQDHLFVQSISMLLFFVLSGQPSCAARSLDDWAKRLDDLAGSRLKSIYRRNFVLASPASFEHPCLQIFMYLHIYIGWIGVSYCVWRVEYNSRWEFLSGRPEQDWPANLRRIPQFIMMMHFIFLWVGLWWCWKLVATLDLPHILVKILSVIEERFHFGV